MSYTFTVNGHLVTTDFGEKPLLSFLREDLKLFGAKDGCSKGQCGACTVIVNAKAVRSCTRKMKTLDGAEIQTIEGLSDGDILHPIQTAFLKEHAYQCGFCTPGMIMALKALLDSNPHSTDAEIKNAIRFNLCRCTGYQQIIDAVHTAVRILDGEIPNSIDNGNGWVGESPATKHGVERVAGSLVFADDMRIDGELEGRVMFTEYPHAKILSIDVSEAEAMPGVVKVITHKDIPGKKFFSEIDYPQQILAIDKVRFIGDPIAVVFAETGELAYEAMKRIHVEYEVLPVIAGIEDAVAPDAVRVHDEWPNNYSHQAIHKGNTAKAFAGCDYVVESDFETSAVDHAVMELCASHAEIGEDGRVTLYGTCQSFAKVPAEVAAALGIDQKDLHYYTRPLGGGFGGREDCTTHIFAALGAQILRRPVRVVYSREEMQANQPKKHPFKLHYKVGATKDGKLQALTCTAYCDSGAYNCTGDLVARFAAVMGSGPFNLPNVDIDIAAVFTNNPVSGAMRGYGSTQTSAALAPLLDELADKCGMSGHDFLVNNCLHVGERTTAGQIIEYSCGFEEALNAVSDAFLKDGGRPEPSGPNKKVGVGYSGVYKNAGYGTGIPDGIGAGIQLTKEGRFEILTGTNECGQGADTVVCQIAAQALGIPYDDIDVAMHNSDTTPYTTGSTNASRTTYNQGNAILGAMAKFRKTMAAFTAENFGGDATFLEVGEKGVYDVRGDTDFCIPYIEIAKKAVELGTVLRDDYYFLDIPGNVPLTNSDNEANSSDNRIFTSYLFNAQIAVIEVDTENGDIKLLRMYAASDCGHAINPALVDGQIYGGIIQGMGYALSEKMVTEKGYIVTKDLKSLGVPTAKDIPVMTSIAIEENHPYGPFGAKGFSEGALNGTAPAIENAVYDAVGVRVRALPIEKKTLLEAMKAKEA
jgi:aldehyde oxidoreductase